jgi:hypothetical protein
VRLLLTLSDLFWDHLAVFLRAPAAVATILAFLRSIAVAFFERVNKRRDRTRSSIQQSFFCLVLRHIAHQLECGIEETHERRCDVATPAR